MAIKQINDIIVLTYKNTPVFAKRYDGTNAKNLAKMFKLSVLSEITDTDICTCFMQDTTGNIYYLQAGDILLHDPFDERHVRTVMGGMVPKLFDVVEIIDKSTKEEPHE